jgi:peptidoglycan/xylan/chitin deacetylase (PgdA/CDA1 family)
MITLNLSIDFELGWGDLGRLTHDDVFYRRVVSGLEQTANVMRVLRQRGIPSTWGVVGACCYSNLEELRAAAPRAFAAVEEQLQVLARKRDSYLEVLFCRGAVDSIAQSSVIELASHGFVHLTPVGMETRVLQDDVVASARVLRKLGGKEVESFIPPQNYHWPDEAFAGSGIRYIRHTPSVFGHPYSDPRTPAKFARLWNDFIHPVRYASSQGDGARLLFLRIDRGERLWNVQLALIRRLLNSGRGSLYLFSHPHNLDTPLVVGRFAQLCDLIAASRDRGAVQFTKFVRELN